MEAELEGEHRRSSEEVKNARRTERRLKELQLAAEEDKRGQDRLSELIEKLQQKIKTYKRQVEEAVSESIPKISVRNINLVSRL